MNESLLIILEVLFENTTPLSVVDLIEISSCDKISVTKALSVLCSIGLVIKERNEKTGDVFFSPVKKINAYHIVSASNIGVDLSFLEKHVSISAKEKKLAIELSSSADKLKEITLNNRKPLLQKRSYLILSKNDDIYENLILLLETTNMSLYDYLEKISKNDTYLKWLLDMHKQSESALIDYSDN